MPTRKQFCQSCLAMVLAGLGAPLLIGKKGDEVKKEEREKREDHRQVRAGLQRMPGLYRHAE